MESTTDKRSSMTPALRIPVALIASIVISNMAFIILWGLAFIPFLKPVSWLIAVVATPLSIFTGIFTFIKLNNYLKSI